MDRVPYRRVTPPRHSRETYSHRTSRYPTAIPDADGRNLTRSETILAQTIISGILMLVVLMICVVDIAPLVSMRDGLRQVLSGATNVEEFVEDVRRFNQDWLTGNTPAAEEYHPALSIPANPPILDPAPEGSLHIQPEPIFIPHIHQNSLTAEDAPSNPQIPGPSTVPGLWD